jgi:hypothetical protein
MKHNIEWHQECSNNSKRYLENQLSGIFNRLENILLDIANDDFRQVQIEEATRQCKDGFDLDKFMKTARIKAKEEAKQRITAQMCQLKTNIAYKIYPTQGYPKSFPCLCGGTFVMNDIDGIYRCNKCKHNG